MKTWKDVTFDTMFTLANAKIAAKNASKKKRNRRGVQRYLQKEDLLLELLKELHTGTYVPRPLTPKIIYDHKSNKQRKIVQPHFRDQIVHWMIMLQLSPHMERVMIRHTVAVIPKRGPILAHRTLEHWAKHHNGRRMRWVVQLDIKQYYASIRHDLMMKKLSRYIRDKKVLAFIQQILTHGGKGLPLGFYLSQWLANFYFDDIDHFIKEKLRIKQYIRYVDDIIFFSPKKSEALYFIQEIKKQLELKGLVFKAQGKGGLSMKRFGIQGLVDYCGIRTYGDGFQELRNVTYLRFRRFFHQVQQGQVSLKQARGSMSKLGHIKVTDCRELKKNWARVSRICGMKRLISKADREAA